MTRSPRPWTELPDGPHDIRLVAVDMDGTLLDGDDEVPSSFWPRFDALRRRGAVLVPASGRQYATLREMFPGEGTPGEDPALAYICDNGTLVMHAGRPVHTVTVDRETVEEVIGIARRLHADEPRAGLVLAGVEAAYVEHPDPAFAPMARRYYADIREVEDLGAVDDDVLKLAVFVPSGAADVRDEAFGHLAGDHQVTLGSEFWIDIMALGAHKGSALGALQEALGVTPAQTAVFGDYLNDLEMMGAGEWSFAMADAHPDVAAASAWRAPSNLDEGVPRVLERLLER